jgi:hypothetical protein
VFAGAADVATIHAARTLDGTTVRQDLESSGYLGREPPGSCVLDCFVEAHIEQGPDPRGRTPHDRHRNEDPGHPLVASASPVDGHGK